MRAFRLQCLSLKRSRWIRDCDRMLQPRIKSSLRSIQSTNCIATATQQRCCIRFSSTANAGTSFFTSPLQWWRNRQEVDQLDKFKKRVAEMADKDAWVVGDAIKEIEDSLNTWRAKIPGASGMNEIKLAKEMLNRLNGIAKVIGNDATEDTMNNMSHKDKLVAAINGETTLEEVNTLIEQFGAMSLMHRALRKRKADGKTMPSSPEAVQAIVKAEAPKLLSKEQKSKLGKEQAKRMMKRGRR
jgi:hypothetical protein